MTRRPDPDAPPARADRVLVALVLLAGGAFVAAVLWMLLGSR
jgi:hypothetical protein